MWNLAFRQGSPGSWLNDKAWGAREIRFGAPIGIVFLAGAYFLFGLLTFMFIAIGLSPTTKSSMGSSFMFVLAALSLCLPGYLTFLWLRHRKYGDSICRLITLPGVIGGWFKADVECKLPPESSEPVLIHLINISGSPNVAEMWRMEQKYDSTPTPVAGTDRSIVHVRLCIPRHPKQVPMPLKASFRPYVLWRLDISKKAPRFDFLAQFSVPIYDIPDAPESEQRPE